MSAFWYASQPPAREGSGGISCQAVSISRSASFKWPISSRHRATFRRSIARSDPSDTSFSAIRYPSAAPGMSPTRRRRSPSNSRFDRRRSGSTSMETAFPRYEIALGASPRSTAAREPCMSQGTIFATRVPRRSFGKPSRGRDRTRTGTSEEFQEERDPTAGVREAPHDRILDPGIQEEARAARPIESAQGDFDDGRVDRDVAPRVEVGYDTREEKKGGPFRPTDRSDQHLEE